ncbi:hypothetical protein SAMN02990966_08013 [Rhodospirillales bacterium URHD0017]|nr:hypothetical protein SAMN02990966_08013 [Rhodospirillales bacterium URHD0017]
MDRSTSDGDDDSDTIVRRIFAAYCGAGLVFALIASALTQ